MKLRLALALALLFGSACGSDMEPDGHDHELAHTADPLTAGTLDCTSRADTGYRSGSAFPIRVVTVDGKPVERRTANAFDQLRRAARRDGVTVAVVSGFRTYDEQAYFRRCYETCSCNNCNLASRPGYSNHQSGAALDLNTSDPGVYRWLERNAARFDFARTVPSEDWHWEYFGGIDDDAPCSASGGNSGNSGSSGAAGLSFLAPTAATGGRELWLKVAVPAGTHHVVYEGDGLLIGASEDPRDDYSSRYVFANAGAHTLVAIAYDAYHRELARTTRTITISGAGQPLLTLRSPSPGAWVRNGVPLRVEAGPEVVAVKWMAGPYELARVTDRASGFLHRAVFQGLGWRALTAVGLDAQGREVLRRSAVVRVMPGDDRAGPVAVALFDTPGASRANDTPLKAVGSDSIVRLVYRADGYILGESRDAAAGFPVRYDFSQTGPRRLEVEGYDAAGQARARDVVEVVIR